MNKIEIYTDGACSGNPGPGGWGAIIMDQDKKKSSLSGGESHTTNNRMELIAVIIALETLPVNSKVSIYTDSMYVKNGITLWIKNWHKNGWKTANKQPVKNVDLWQRLDSISSSHNISWNWVRGHSGHDLNEEVDALARSSIHNTSTSELT